MNESHNPDILLIDINGLGYASMYIPALSKLNFKGFDTGGIHGALASLYAVMQAHPKALPVVLWDRHATWRYDIYPEYKSNRGNTPEKIAVKESYKKQCPIIQMIIGALGIPQVTCEEAEADDLAGIICREIDPSWSISLASHDTDWWQAIDKNILWYSPRTKSNIDLSILADVDNGLESNFLSTQEYLQAKALSGDTSDTIAGLNGIGLKTAVKIMREHGGTIESFWAKVDSKEFIPKGVKQSTMASQDAREIFKRNMSIMDWKLSPPLKHQSLALMAGKTNWGDAEDIASDYGLSKIINRGKEVLSHWEEHGWGDALLAVDSSLNHHICQQNKKK